MLLAILAALGKSKNWSLADAISEETSDTNPKLVASSSRFIALIGMAVLVSIVFGIGLAIIVTILNGKSVGDLQNVLWFLFGAASLFAPYMANQLREAFSGFAGGPPPPGGPSGGQAAQPAGNNAGNTGNADSAAGNPGNGAGNGAAANAGNGNNNGNGNGNAANPNPNAQPADAGRVGG